MGRHRRGTRATAPVRTGLLGVSAALTVGAFAVTGGLIPGQGEQYTVGTADGPTGPVEPETSADLATRGAAPATPLPDTRAASPSPDGHSRSSAEPRASRSADRTTPPARPEPHSPTPSRTAGPGTGSPAPSSPDPTPVHSSGDETASPASTAEARVLRLVNDERAQAGCRPVDSDPDLAGLAGDYSAQMAEEDFFAHTTPDGLSPWDRAEAAGIAGLGGENIARGQQDAQAVMDAWMHSPGHRANILNCDFTELGVGVHFGPGGPWWTQDFGY